MKTKMRLVAVVLGAVAILGVAGCGKEGARDAETSYGKIPELRWSGDFKRVSERVVQQVVGGLGAPVFRVCAAQVAARVADAVDEISKDAIKESEDAIKELEDTIKPLGE